METNTAVAEKNTERLIEKAYQGDEVPQFFAATLEAKLVETAQALAAQRSTTPAPARVWHWQPIALVLGGLAACILVVFAVLAFQRGNRDDKKQPLAHEPPKRKPTEDKLAAPPIKLAKWTDDVREAMMPRIRPEAAPLSALKPGEKLATKAGQRRLVQLADGTRLFVDEKSEVIAAGDRQLTLNKGRIYLEVAPKDDATKFVVTSGIREMTATGTHFAVQADAVGAGLVVTQGKVAVKGLEPEIVAGQRIEPGSAKVTVAPRASHELEWTRELMAAAESPMVPACQHAGGQLVAIDPRGQEIKLALRQYHIDVHIEDGFARTNIDQTYFNTTWERLEGTFYFPLPPDASLSRLAMYVVEGNQCKLMEGGMAERKHAADVYETIRYQRRDPALLEWLDGSTFKMRVFPLEAKQEKRILLSYTQKLSSLYGITRYRFPGGLNMPLVREWSFSARIKGGQGMNVWSTTHGDAQILPQSGDTLVKLFGHNIKPEADVALEMQDKLGVVDNDSPRLATFTHENHEYLMLRYRPTLARLPERQRRDWIVLFESSAGRDPLLAGTQVDLVRELLKNAEYDDTFILLTANSKVQPFHDKAQLARPKNVAAAIAFLQKSHLVGALDLEQGLRAAVEFAKQAKNPHIVHVGGGTPATGERDAGALARLLPESVPYVGVGVGKRWNRAFMKAAAERTSGLFTQINPDETVAWRAFELLATLNTPRLLNVQVAEANERSNTRFLMETSMIAQGEEIFAVARVDTAKHPFPGKLIVTGTNSSARNVAGDREFRKEVPVFNVQAGAGYLPRTWAKLEIDRLLAANASQHKNEVIALSKAMYVMSPFTSLLVLETDADYERFKVDKGRKDHWAMYPAPPKIPLVYEPGGPAPKEVKKDEAKGKKPSIEEVLRTMLMPGVELPDGGFVYFGGAGYRARDFDEEFGLDNKELTTWGLIANERKARLAPRRSELEARDEIMITDIFGRPQTIKDKLKDVEKEKDLGKYLSRMAKEEKRLDLYRGAGLTQNEADRVRRRQRLFFESSEMPRLLQSEVLQGLDTFLGQPQQGQQSPDNPVGEKKNTKMPPALGLPPLARGTMPAKKPGAPRMPHGGGFGPFGGGGGIPVTVARRGFQVVNGRLVMERLSTLAMDESLIVLDGKALQLRKKKPGDPAPGFGYVRPAFEYDKKFFTNLMDYAPGLHATWADVLAVLETEAEINPPTLGTIDPVARRLIAAARATGWQTLTLPAQGPLPAWKVTFNGSGQFVYERLLLSGLREEVICDGKSLISLYPEIGLASKRPFSRHHFDVVAGINPTFLPDADELARGFDVKALDASTIAMVPLGAAELKADDKYARLHLIFAKSGKLAERRIVEMPAGKTFERQIFHDNGVIEWQDETGKSLGKETLTLAPAKAPSLTPKTDDLVVVNLPTRTSAHVIAQAAKAKIDPNDPAVVAERFVSDCLRGDSYAEKSFAASRVLEKSNPRRLGYMVLMSSVGALWLDQVLPHPSGKGDYIVRPHLDHPDSALALFLVQAQRELHHGQQNPLKKLPGSQDGFIQKLSRFRDLWMAWHLQRPLQNPTEMPLAKAQVMEFLQGTTSPTFAYAVLDTMQRRSSTPPTEHMLSLAQKRFGPVSDPAGVGYLFRYEHARSLQSAGVGSEAAKRFLDLYADTLKLGVLPPIDRTFRDALQMPGNSGPRFIGFTRQTLDDLLAKKQIGLALQLAKQMEQLGDEALCDEILATIQAKAPADEKDALTLLCARFYAARKSYVQADRLLQKLVEDKKLAEAPELWRMRYEMTRNAGQVAASIACLEKALDLEYAEMPELVNLESIRTDYRTLLNHYQRIAEASASLEKSANKAFLAKVIRTADRWRLLDSDSSEPSMLAGKILFTMDERNLAWDYWTTPIDLHPAESRPWLDLAETMKTEGDLDKADRAFALAFESEPTNPTILMSRAQNLVRLGQADRARQLYRQIADNEWQERFAAVVEQAKGLAGQ